MLTAPVWGLCLPAAAQTGQQLPPVIIEGATLDIKPVRPSLRPSGTATSTAFNMPAGGSAGQDGGAADPWQVTSDKLGSSVLVVTGADLANAQVRHAADALRGLPGVSVGRTGGFAGLTQVRIRGAEANHTLVLIDGVEANQVTNGEFDFSSLPADGIERIEVIKGPQSGLVGSNAIGGVVNIITKRGEGPMSVQLKSEFGSMGTRDVSAIVSGGSRQMHGAVTLVSRSTDGFNISSFGDEADNAKQQLAAFKGGIRPTETFAIDVMARRTIKTGGRDDDSFGPPGSLSVQTDTASFFKWNVLMMGAEARLDTFDGRWTHAIRGSSNTTQYEDTSNTPTFFNVYRDKSGVDKLAYLSTFRLATEPIAPAKHTLTAMVESEKEHYTPLSRDNDKRERERVNTALEYRGVFRDALALGATVRHDDNDTFADFTTWRGSASLKIAGTGLRPHVSIGTGVKYPTLFEQYGQIPQFFQANPNLKPEESTGWDAGLEMTVWGGRAVLDLTTFSADVTNKIKGDGKFPEMPINLAGVSLHRGLESAVKLRLMPTLTASLGHTYLDARDNVGLEEIRRPKHSGHAGVTYGFSEGRGQVTASAKYNGRATDEAFRLPFFTRERVLLDDYWLIALAASYKVQPNVELFGRVENLLDARAQDVFGFETAGAAVYGGVKITLEDVGRR